jgi:WD40 repeat protein
MDLVGNSIPVSSVDISEDGNLLMSKTTGKINSARIWDLNQGRLLSSFEGEASFSDSGRTVVTMVPDRSSAIIYHWNSARGEKTDSVTVKADSVVKCYYSPDGSSLVAVNNEYEAILVNAETGESITHLRGPVTSAVYSPDSKLVVTSSWFSYLNLWDAQTGKLTATLTRDNNDYTKETIGYQVQAIDSSENISVSITPETEFSRMSDREKNFVSGVPESMVQFSRDGKVITAIRGENSSTCLWDVVSGKLLYMSATNLNVNPDVTRAVLAGAYWEEGDSAVSRVIDLKTGKTQFRLDKLSYTRIFLGQEFSPDGKSILASYQDSAKLWDSENGNLKQSFHYSGRILGTDWKRNRIIVHDNSRLIFFDMITGKQLFTFIAIDLDDYLVVTPDNYYMGTKNAASKISWRAGSNLYRFDQFDLQYNRPDIVLERMGNSDSSLIKLYHNAYEKRLKKSGFTENMFSPVWHTPTVEIINYDSLDFEPGKYAVTLRVRASDDLYRINSIVIRVNGVPENGTRGYSFTGQNRNDITNDFKVKLSQGENDITVSCFNEKGVESYRETLDIQNNTMMQAKPDLYFIGMSVSDYKDQRFNLGYAVKDGRDMASLFEETGMDSKNFSHVFIDTLFNRKAIKSNFLEMKKKLSGSSCDDQVVVFISGHGLLDKKLDFYYATWDMNFKKPESKGLSFDEMESILDGIPARRKLFMMDACHSGEMDKEEFTSDENNYQAKKEDVVFRGMLKEYRPKGDYSKTMSSGLNLDQSFELMQEMFAGLDQGTGTNVISAASGKGFALESPSWNNGVFTFSILNGLKKMAADFNNDKSVSVSELRRYAINRVQLLTGGRQKPTSRRETLTFDWNIR